MKSIQKQFLLLLLSLRISGFCCDQAEACKNSTHTTTLSCSTMNSSLWKRRCISMKSWNNTIWERINLLMGFSSSTIELGEFQHGSVTRWYFSNHSIPQLSLLLELPRSLAVMLLWNKNVQEQQQSFKHRRRPEYRSEEHVKIICPCL